MKWIGKVPTGVLVTLIIVSGVGVVALLGGFLLLTLNDKPTDEYRAFVNTVANLVTLALSGLAAAGAVSAAKSASNAEDNTNGVLTAKTHEIADAAVSRALDAAADATTPTSPAQSLLLPRDGAL